MEASIIITTYNYDKFIEESISSCLNQETDFNYEIIVIDDGSVDETSRILKKFSNYCSIYTLENCGIEKAANYGVRVARAPYFVRLDADDVFNKNLLQEGLTHIKDTKADFVYSHYENINEESSSLGFTKLPEFQTEEIFSRGDFLATGTLFDKRSFLNAGGFNETVKNCGLENFELILKIITNGGVGNLINKVLFKYRTHSNNMSLKRKESIVDYGRTLFEKENYGIFRSNEFHPYGLSL